MKAKDIMTPNVITVGLEATVSDIANTMLERHISALPVVDEKGRVVGIISEGDLVRRHEIGTGNRRRSWWLNLLADPADQAEEYVKSHAAKARDIMTSPAIMVDGEATVPEIAETLEKNHIKRVPVLRGDRLVGIVSRANIVQLVAAARRHEIPAASEDEAIREAVLGALANESWGRTSTMNVTVADGVVEFWGVVFSEAERTASRVAAESVAGVRRVDDHRDLRPVMGLGEW